MQRHLPAPFPSPTTAAADPPSPDLLSTATVDAADSALASASLNTLRLALCTMKERCQRQQRRIEELEKDNVTVRLSRSELYREVKRLHETNMKLREKNLQMSQKLHKQSKENLDVRDQLNSLQFQHSSSVRQLERLQTEVAALTTSMHEEPSPQPTEASSSPMSLSSSLAELHQHQQSEEEEALMYGEDMEQQACEATLDQMADIKARLLEQQGMLRAAMKRLAETVRTREEAAAASLTPLSSLADSASAAATVPAAAAENAAAASAGRRCPMCEAAFPGGVAQEDFEAHVVEHFSYEEGDTLRNFDLVPDAISFVM